MADLQAFRGIRYDLSRVGDLRAVTAPPYDVIDPAMQGELYAQHPHNIVRLILHREDDCRPDEDVYTAAARTFRAWQRDGILKQDSQNAVYVYHQKFEYEGQSWCRRGFIGRIRIEPFGEGRIYPHEETHAHARNDRIRLTEACQANLSQIFSVYPDEENQVQETLEAALSDHTPWTATDPLGVEHQLWTVTDPAAISQAASLLGQKPLYIADGHHRYETATEICRRQLAASDLPADHPVRYVSMMCVSMDDPGLIVLPTHRLFRGMPSRTSAQLIQQLGTTFDCRPAGQSPATARQLWEQLEVEGDQDLMAFYCRADDTWVLARATAEGHALMKEHLPEKSDAWRSLGVALLHGLVVDRLLGAPSAAPRYSRDLDELIHALKEGDETGRDATGQMASGEPFELAALVMPAGLDQIRAVSEAGERMPAKSTFFYPKLLSGLVINPLS